MIHVRKAQYFEKMKDGKVECLLCPHHCMIPASSTGICGIRFNNGGVLTPLAYGYYPAVHMDPVEKKPLNHFMPGSDILSLGSVGCNLRCLHCQNWSLARSRMEKASHGILEIKDLVREAGKNGSIGVAFTYNEPTINFEYLLQASKALKEKGLKVVLVTNGYLEDAPWKELMEYVDGANIDVKGFTDDFYRDITGGRLDPVLRNVRTAFEMGVHVEIAYLVIPGRNDDGDQTERFIHWVKKDLSPELPIHFNRFHPDHQMMDVPATPAESLMSIRDLARERGIKHVFIGNLAASGVNDTECPSCGKVVIKRDGFFGPKVHLKDGRCPWCGHGLKGVWS